jgi:hypothetical protein
MALGGERRGDHAAWPTWQVYAIDSLINESNLFKGDGISGSEFFFRMFVSLVTALTRLLSIYSHRPTHDMFSRLPP